MVHCFAVVACNMLQPARISANPADQAKAVGEKRTSRLSSKLDLDIVGPEEGLQYPKLSASKLTIGFTLDCVQHPRWNG
jgi:hypothetical protein